MMPDRIIEQHDERQPDPRAFFVTHHLPALVIPAIRNRIICFRYASNGTAPFVPPPVLKRQSRSTYHSSFHFNHLIILSHPSALVAPIQAILSKHSFVQYL